jgi:RNA polymerase sigma factor (sigma-70 family)
MLRARDGDPGAFVRLLGEMKPFLLGRLRGCPQTQGLCRCRADVEDAYSEMTLKLWAHRRKYRRTRGPVVALAWVVLRNHAVDVLRWRKTRRGRAAYDKEGHLTLEPADDSPAPEKAVEAAERARAVREGLTRVLSRKAPGVRRAWELRVVEGPPFEAVAERLGVPRGMVGGWIYKVKEALRRELA